MIEAEIVADSKNEFGNRITTFKLTFPRIVLAEFNTHRMISRNSASSRAIPTNVMIDNLVKNPFKPIKWLKEHTGMQGFDYWPEDSPEAIAANIIWSDTRWQVIQQAKSLLECEVSKQFINRLLEPFMWHTIIATATEWENFFALRAHPMAEIHIQDLAFKMLEKYNESEPKLLQEGQWHIPFENLIDIPSLHGYIDGKKDYGIFLDEDLVKVKVSAAICAGISYGRIKEVTSITDLVDLHDSLVLRPYEGKRGTRTEKDPIHASPVEHQAKAMTDLEYKSWGRFEGWESTYYENHDLGWCKNFRGFIQNRAMIENENAKDERVLAK